ncbi:MAG: penicillin-binding protein 2 [Alphaproteobacteria bacterium]|nr:penicillin-binding protein 2 [Alphaproteobacteria bacterium]
MKRQDSDRSRVFTRRAVVVGVMQGALLAVLGGRLAWLQVAEGSRYRMLSDKNRINIKMLAPSRGQIVDRYGVPLAVNDQNFRVLLIPEQTDDLEKSLRHLQKVISLEEQDIKRVLKQAKGKPAFLPIEVRDQLSWTELARIEVNLTELPGLTIDVGELRSYPLGRATSHLVGYVGAVSPSDLRDGDPMLSLPGFRIGKTGAERAFDEDLRGKAGSSEVEVNVVGREVRELKRSPSNAGDKVTLTVDAELQRFVQSRLEQETSASAVIMDAYTGAVYALASGPGFDPNLLTRGISAQQWEELVSDPTFPLNNKAVAGQYPPGSTFKMITALAGLENHHVTRNTTVFCPGHYRYGEDLFHCWSRGGHGTVDVVGALAESCDVFFYKVSTDIGIESIAEMAHRFGLGQTFGFELREESPGLVPDKEWKMGHFGKPWQPGETIVASIGQGYLQATPLQLAVMTARLVNGGHAVEPWITGFVGDRVGKDVVWPKIGVGRHNLDLVVRGMNAVMLGPRGTAHASQIETPGLQMGGKTGTSQVRRITVQDRLEGVRNEDLPWKFRHHALFVGYAPFDRPQYVCAVVVEHGGSGSGTAAPVARDLLLEAQRRAPAKVPLRPGGYRNVGTGVTPPPRKPKGT